MTDQIPTDAELRERLTPEQYEVTQHKGTERAFSGVYWDCHDDGVYRCVVCETPLFRSNTKYESGTGWPSFWEPIEGAVTTESDRSYGMVRTEARAPPAAPTWATCSTTAPSRPASATA